MQKIKEISKKLLVAAQTRGVAFWLLIPVVVLSLIIPFVYNAGFGDTYFSAAAFTLPFMALPVFATAFFRPTARYTAVASFACELAGLLLFVAAAYMHLSTAFFNGIEGNVLVQAGFPFSFCTIAYLINIALCAAAVFCRQFRAEKAPAAETHAEEAKND